MPIFITKTHIFLTHLYTLLHAFFYTFDNQLFILYSYIIENRVISKKSVEKGLKSVKRVKVACKSV